MDNAIIYSSEKIHHEIIPGNGAFPNNAYLPVIFYKGVLELPDEKPEKVIEQIFESNDWSNAWINGIYEYHHFHSITHEVVGVFRGYCNVMLGGPGSKK